MKFACPGRTNIGHQTGGQDFSLLRVLCVFVRDKVRHKNRIFEIAAIVAWFRKIMPHTVGANMPALPIWILNERKLAVRSRHASSSPFYCLQPVKICPVSASVEILVSFLSRYPRV